MKKYIFVFSSIFLLGLTIGLLFNNHSLAVAQQKDFSNVEIVYPSYGSIGIYDKKEGKLYYYDNNNYCIKIFQINELGRGLTKVEPPARFSSY